MKIPNQKQILSKNKPGSKSQRAIDANITNTLNTVSKAVIESVHKTQQYMKPSDLLSMDIVLSYTGPRKNRFPEMAK